MEGQRGKGNANWRRTYYVPGSVLSNLHTYLVQSSLKKKKSLLRDFPGGPVVKNPPSNARDAGWIPGGGTRFPHAAGQ